MKKLLVFVFVFVVFLSVNVYADDVYDVSIEMQIGQNESSVNGVNVKVDDNKNVTPFVIDGRTLVPLRFIADNLGLNVEWKEDTQSVILTNSDTEIILIIGENTVSLNGVSYEEDSCPILENQRTFVPVRFIAETLQCNVWWDAETQKVIIKREKEVEIDINDEEVQKLYKDILNQKEFASYYFGYVDINTLDHYENIFSGITRSLVSVLRFEEFEEKQYSKKEAEKVITKFLSEVDEENSLSYDEFKSLQYLLEQGVEFGSDSKYERLVGIYDGEIFDKISVDYFGVPLPEYGSVGYSVSYANFHFFNNVNVHYPYSKTTPYNVYYNQINDTYMFTRYTEDYMDYGYDEKLELDLKLIKATKHNGKLSLYLQPYSKMYEKERTLYDGVCRNTYQKGDDGYYWVSSYGKGNIANVNEAVLKRVENNALKYINSTYGDFTVVNINAEYKWMENHYIVEYDDGNGDIRTVVFDSTGEKVVTDRYIYEKAWSIVNQYESNIKQKVELILQEILGKPAYYIIIDDNRAYGKDFEIAMENLDISNDPVECTVGINGHDDATTLEFAKLCKEIYVKISLSGLPIESLEIIQQNSEYGRFDLTCPYNMGELTIEEIDKLIEC